MCGERVWGPARARSRPRAFLSPSLTTFAHPEDVRVAQLDVDPRLLDGSPATQQHAIELACLISSLWIGFARGRADEGRFVRYAAACVVAFIAFGKVLSPQYLIWLIPLVPLVAGLRGLIVSGLLASAMIGTQFWVSAGGSGVYIHGFQGAPFVLARNLLLFAIPWSQCSAVRSTGRLPSPEDRAAHEPGRRARRRPRRRDRGSRSGLHAFSWPVNRTFGRGVDIFFVLSAS